MGNLQSEGVLQGIIDSYRDTIDYNALTNKPIINSQEVKGTHNGRYYGLTESEIIDWIDYDILPEETKKNGKVYYIRNVETFEEKTISNVAIASFNDGSSNPLVSLKIDIVPNQEGSGTPAPDNVRPISGWNSVEVTRTGKNILPTKFYSGIGYNNNVGLVLTPTELDDVTQSGNTYSRDVRGWYGFGMITDYLPNGTYYLSSYLESSNMRSSIYVIDSNMKVVRNLGNVATGTTRTIANSITLSDDEHYIAFSCLTSVDGTVKITEPQVTVGSTATSYEPYNSDTETISLGQTIYGGTLNATTGELTVDRAIIDLGAINWTYNSGGQVFCSNQFTPRVKTNGKLLCEQYDWNSTPNITPSSLSDNQISASPFFNINTVMIKDSRYTDAATFNTAVSGIKLCYELASPTTIYITPTIINLLLGANNIWANSGDINEVKYLSPTGSTENQIRTNDEIFGRA